MRDEHNETGGSGEHQPKARREMSRRQFLSYTLGGTGAFMAAGMLVPMLRFAVDPVLKPAGESAWVKVIEESKVTEQPQEIKFSVFQVDGWYESEPEFAAWIAKDAEGKIFALSPVCKHLGCMVGWNGDPRYQDQYYCPCHGAHYTKDGATLAVSPLPLDEYDVKIEEGFVYLGQVKPNSRV